MSDQSQQQPTLSGFQQAAALGGVSADICAKLPTVWPPDRMGIAVALTGNGFQAENPQALSQTVALIEGYRPAVTASAEQSEQLSLSSLPTVPETLQSFITALKTGGKSIVQPIDVVAAIRAAIATYVGLYDLPETLRDEIYKQSKKQKKPAGETFYIVDRFLNESRYGEVLQSMGVIGGSNFVSKPRKEELINNVNAHIWRALYDFNVQLTNWSNNWMQGSNSTMSLAVIAAQIQGQQMLHPNLLKPPATNNLRAQAEQFINVLNEIFSGVGIPVARALAYAASRINELLDNPELPLATGSPDKESMINDLGYNIGPDLLQLEAAVSRYAISIMKLPEIPAGGKEEQYYLLELLTLGQSINWEGIQRFRRGVESVADAPFRRRS
jgi:hypothetical protein